MADKKQIADGIILYAEAELLPALDGWQLWAAGAVLGLLYTRAETLIDKLLQSKYVTALGLTGEDGGLDIEAAGEALKKSARKYGKIKVDVPVIDIQYTFSEKDIEALLACIRKAGGAQEGK